MKPILQRKIEQILSTIETLRDVLEDNRTELREQHAQKEAMLEERWRQRKEVTTLQRIARDYDELETENATLQRERQELRDHLSNIVKCTKALQEVHRP